MDNFMDVLEIDLEIDLEIHMGGRRPRKHQPDEISGKLVEHVLDNSTPDTPAEELERRFPPDQLVDVVFGPFGFFFFGAGGDVIAHTPTRIPSLDAAKAVAESLLGNGITLEGKAVASIEIATSAGGMLPMRLCVADLSSRPIEA
jgi:hypothetical protein